MHEPEIKPCPNCGENPATEPAVCEHWSLEDSQPKPCECCSSCRINCLMDWGD